MSMTEHLGGMATHDLSALEPETIASLQRIEGLAKRNRRDWARKKHGNKNREQKVESRNPHND